MQFQNPSESFPEKQKQEKNSVLQISPGPDMGVFNLLLFLILIHIAVAARDTPGNEIQNIAESSLVPPPPPPPTNMETPRIVAFRPGIAIVVAAISFLFSIIFLLLLYVKHCTGIVYVVNPNHINHTRKNSGINRKVVEMLPMFLFSSLRGQKDGLECAVCLTRFEPEEVLRLLPKCKHAFHVECVDTWLDEHSSCPLCRNRVDPEDIRPVDNTKRKEIVGTRIVSRRHSSFGSRGDSVEIVVENPGRDLKKGRFSFDNWKSRRRSEANTDIRSKSTNSWSASKSKRKSERKDGLLPVQGEKHRVDHRIIISVGGEAELEAADNLYLGSEMLMVGEDEGSGRGVINDRSVSEITGMGRYKNKNNRGKEIEEEEGVGKNWIPKSQQLNKTANFASTSSSTTVMVRDENQC